MYSSTRRTFLQHLGYGAAGVALTSWSPLGLRAEEAVALSGAGLPRTTPEEQGISSKSVLSFLEALREKKIEFHSFIVARHGRVVAEGWWAPYGPAINHTMYSMSKSFTSTAVGLAVKEGKLHVDDRVISFFPKDLPTQVSDHLAALQVKHLLTMSVGHDKEPTHTMVDQENWVKAFLAAPIVKPPGTAFLYNSAATYMLSAIVQKVTGQKVIDYLRPRLFAPLGISGMTWETCPRGINTGGWGLSISTEGLARFGQLYLQKGEWEGKRLLPAKWVEEATTFKIQQPTPAKPTRPNEQNDWLQGYCYQFWRCQHQAFRGDGAFGQFTIVLPEQDAVIAITGESNNLQGELDLVWEHLLPGMKDTVLPPDNAAQAELQRAVAGLKLEAPHGQLSSHAQAQLHGKTIHLEPNSLGITTASFAFQDQGCEFSAQSASGLAKVENGAGQWRLGQCAVPGTPPRIIAGGAPKSGTPAKVAASGVWKDDNTYEMTWRYYETPHRDTVTCQVKGNEVTIAFESSINQLHGNAKDSRPVLKGKLA